MEPSNDCGTMAPRLEQLPGTLEHLAVLRVHERGILRREAEEGRIEPLLVVERSAGTNVVGALEELRADAGFDELRVLVLADRLAARSQVLPELGDATSPGESSGGADDGNVGIAWHEVCQRCDPLSRRRRRAARRFDALGSTGRTLSAALFVA